MPHVSEYEVETKFIDRLESIGYEYVELKNYDDVIDNFRSQIINFNQSKLKEAKGSATLSDAEFNRILIHLDNKSVYDSAKILRDKYVLSLDNGKTVYLDFFSYDTDRNIYQVSHQITMDKEHKDDVSYKNRYDVTVLINGLPLVQIELKRPGVEINEAINQINRYRKFSFKGLFRYLQLFVVSNSVQTKNFCNENEMENGLYNPILKSLVFFWTDEKNKRINTLEEFTAEFFRKASITEMIDKFMVIKSTEPVHSNGSAIKNIPPFADLKPMEVLMPSIEEQKKISGFFDELDNLITLHQRECDKYKELKKGLLQLMFV